MFAKGVRLMIAIITIFYLCAGGGDLGECHTVIDAEFDLNEHEVSQDAHMIFLEEHDWLLAGELAYCPVCRFELHD